MTDSIIHKKQAPVDQDDEEHGNTNHNVHIPTIVLGKPCPKESNHPVTVMVKHKVRPDKLNVFAEWIQEIVRLSHPFPGYLNTEVIRPTDADETNASYHEYVAIFRYDTYEHLQGWMNSSERQDMIDRIPEFSANTSVVYKYHSLEHWFTAGNNNNGSSSQQDSSDSAGASSSSAAPPPRYKMVVVTTAVIYSQTLWIPEQMAQLNLHPDVLGLLTTFAIVLVATYVLFPIVTRLLGFWLFPTRNYGEMLLELVPSFLWKRQQQQPQQDGSEESNSPHTKQQGEDDDPSTAAYQLSPTSSSSSSNGRTSQGTPSAGSNNNEEDCPPDDGNLENV